MLFQHAREECGTRVVETQDRRPRAVPEVESLLDPSIERRGILSHPPQLMAGATDQTVKGVCDRKQPLNLGQIGGRDS